MKNKMENFNPIYQTLNKYTAIYRIRIKEINDLVIATDSELKENWEIKEFKWQQKVFNNFEKQFYGDEKNCVTDIEKQYNLSLINSVNATDDRILFSYIDNDNFNCDIESTSILKNTCDRKQAHEENSLEEILENNEEYDYRHYLDEAIEDVGTLDDYSVMFIMADMGEYIQENWVKFEHILCTLKYNKEKNILIICPDFSQRLPYRLQLNSDSIRTFYYFIENASEDIPEELAQKENEIFKKISEYRLSLKNITLNTTFELPSKNTLEVHIFFEIVSGQHFEYDDIYVKYFIDLPEKWTCKNSGLLNGITQTCRGKGHSNLVTFGHVFDLILNYDIQDFFDKGFPKYPYIYFEVISRGSWDRYRCEGLTFKCLPIAKPDSYHFDLPCYRLTDGRMSDLRRFFIGDCSNYNDITWIGLPKSVKGSIFNKYGVQTVGTGTLSVRMNVIHQSQAFLTKYNEAAQLARGREKYIFDKLNSSTLVKSVEQVLEAFKRARENMIQARNT
ncbi:hypothetical protein WA026_002654 [Henosepilachna vigintioctopunctata]|uniref:TIR domain-containing protein n=1 Tax=Henosepilachna vigintioctopunctata TaxID=420089 RepID=A0AAW1U027_9CUCU